MRYYLHIYSFRNSFRAKRTPVITMGGIATTSGAIDFIISQITNKDMSTSAQALGQVDNLALSQRYCYYIYILICNVYIIFFFKQSLILA